MTPDFQEQVESRKKMIADETKANKIVLYMKGTKLSPLCGFSAQVVHILNQFNQPFETRNVLEDEALRQAIKDFSNWPTIPQLYINGEFIGGCDIATELYQNGELAKLLA